MKPIILIIKNYVYEKQPNGKKKRVSPIKINDKGEVCEIVDRAIKGAYKF